MEICPAGYSPSANSILQRAMMLPLLLQNPQLSKNRNSPITSSSLIPEEIIGAKSRFPNVRFDIQGVVDLIIGHRLLLLALTPSSRGHGDGLGSGVQGRVEDRKLR